MVEEQRRKTVKGKKQGGWWWWWGGRCGGTNAKLAGRRMGRKDVNERKTKSLLLSPVILLLGHITRPGTSGLS